MQLDKLVVATDDERIFKAVKEFGGEAIMTDPACDNGTERCLEVLKTLQAAGEKYDIVVNIQVPSLPNNLLCVCKCVCASAWSLWQGRVAGKGSGNGG